MRSLKNGRNILYLFCRLGRPVHACWIHSHSILLMALQFCQEKHVLTDSPTIHSTLRASNMAMGNTFNKGFNWKGRSWSFWKSWGSEHVPPSECAGLCRLRRELSHSMSCNLDFTGVCDHLPSLAIGWCCSIFTQHWGLLPPGNQTWHHRTSSIQFDDAAQKNLQLQGTSHFHVAGYFIPLVPNNLTIGVLWHALWGPTSPTCGRACLSYCCRELSWVVPGSYTSKWLISHVRQVFQRLVFQKVCLICNTFIDDMFFMES